MPVFRSAMRLALIIVSVLASSVFAARPDSVAGAASAAPAARGNAQWDDRFGMAFGQRFAGYGVNAAAVFQGELYVAGDLNDYYASSPPSWQSANNIFAIARWNGRRWANVGIWSSNAQIKAMLVHDNNLYVTGLFSQAGGVPATNIARWDGVSWHALGAGIADTSSFGDMALAVWDGDLYVGGRFTTAGGVPANSVARWDGAAWHAVGAGPPDDQGDGFAVTALAATPGGLYAGGYFNRSGTQSTPLLARWDGAQWSAVIPELRGVVTGLAWHGGQLYIAGGLYLGAAGIPGSSVIRWDGAQAQFVMDGLPANIVAWTIRSIDGELYVVTSNYLSRWNGAAWVRFGQPFQDYTYNEVFDLVSYNNRLIAVGSMVRSAPNVYGRYLLEWDGGEWAELSAGVRPPGFDSVTSLALADGALYATSRQGILANGRMSNLGRWDGATWADASYAGNATGISISALAGAGASLYAAGSQYNAATSTTTYFVARLDGAGWTTLSTEFNGPINALAWSDGVLYAGGDFTLVGSLAARGLARWDGAAWSDVYGGLLYNVKALAVQAGAVYASGTEAAAAGAPNRIARGTVAGWSVLAESGANALALDLAGALYAGGSFSAIGGVPAANIARWRAGVWEALGSGTNSDVYALEFGPAGVLYVGGAFNAAGGVPSRGIARYDGGWAALGRGVSGQVYALEADAQDVYVGGGFLSAGNYASHNIALWHSAAAPNVAPQANPDQESVLRGETVDIMPLANDTDVDDDSLSITAVSTPTHGSAQMVGTALRYTPAADFVGTATFSYTISDGQGGSASAAVFVTIANRPPAATLDVMTIVRGQPVDIAVLANDTDADQDRLTITSVATPTHGTAQVVSDTLRYTPANDFVGIVKFTYTISDGFGGTSTTHVTVTINNRNPQAAADAAMTVRGQAVDIAVLANDSDADQDALTITNVTPPTQGAVALSGGALRYTPAAEYVGADSFGYTISDGFGGTATTMVTVVVSAPISSVFMPLIIK